MVTISCYAGRAAATSLGLKFFDVQTRKRRSNFNGFRVSVLRIRASARQSRESVDGRGREGEGRAFGGSAMEVTTFNQGFSDAEFPVWEKLGAIIRLTYGIGIYGAMDLVGRLICSILGIDCLGGFNPTLNAILEGLGYATPIMALLFILDICWNI